MKLDIKVIIITIAAVMLMVDLSLLIRNISPIDAYNGKYNFIMTHAIVGFLSGYSIGKIVNK